MFNPSEVAASAGVPAVPAQRGIGPVPGRPGVPEGSPVRWQRRLRSLVIMSDVGVVLVVTTLAVLAGWTGMYAADRAQLVCGAIAAALLIAAMPLARAWDGRILGVGSTEFRRLGRAVAGAAVVLGAVDGLPLLQLSQPRFTGSARVVKTVVDRTVAGALLLLAAPVFVAVAVAVKLDGGPVFFRQERVGTNGRTFRMVKFRSMVVDAEARLAALSDSNEAAGPLFKMTRDPRITKVGVVMRKYSLDELPQLLNVLGGSMSLVGPRPPLPAEVATYEDVARRRLLVRPGMTGLWQVSGRSDLSWEETVRLDLRYVENWSMALDLTILWKTIGAVLRSRGAY